MRTRPELVRPVLLYDGECRLCRFAARTLARIDRERALAFVPLQDEGASELLRDLPAAERMRSWRLVRPDETSVGYGAGLPELLSTLRLTRPLGRTLRGLPDSVLDRAYFAVARHRSRLGGLVPDGAGPRRFP